MIKKQLGTENEWFVYFFQSNRNDLFVCLKEIEAWRSSEKWNEISHFSGNAVCWTFSKLKRLSLILVSEGKRKGELYLQIMLSHEKKDFAWKWKTMKALFKRFVSVDLPKNLHTFKWKKTTLVIRLLFTNCLLRVLCLN